MMHSLFRFATALTLLAAGAATAGTLDQVRERGVLRCGVNQGLPGFAESDAQGHWRGLDVDVCRAVAAAALGDAARVTYVPLDARERFEALTAGKVDLLARNSTWTMERDLMLAVDFAGVNYFDGQGFLVSRDKGLRSALELDGVSVCVVAGTTSESNVREYFQIHRMRLKLVTVDSSNAGIEAFGRGECEVLTGDQSGLYALRTKLAQPRSASVLPEVISKEPLGPAVREDDSRWLALVRWTLFSMINAEELGIGSHNVQRVREQAREPAIRRLLGLEGDYGKRLGVDAEWAYRILSQVGNYAESYRRNVGRDSALRIPRGQNALWRDGGLLYAPPAR